MDRVKKLSLAVYAVIFILVLGVVGARNFILHAIEHNMTINIVISILFVISLIFSLYSAKAINSKFKTWSSFLSEEYTDLSKTVNHIFGEKFNQLIDEDGNKKDELLHVWTEHTEWNARILDYLSGTLIGLGLLGTFIGLMHTMGSISDVLSAASGDDMVKAIAVPLSSMSSAFSASLMGLLSSLSVGLLGVLIDRLNSEFVDNIKSWFYNRESEENYIDNSFLFEGMQVKKIDSLSDSLIKDSLVKINAFCYQAERFLSEIDSRIENFKIEIAGAFNKITDEVIKINAVTESINRCTDMVTESNQQICREILNAREDIMALNQLSISLNEGVKNEIYINRREVIELKKQSNLASCKIQNELLLNRNEMLRMNKLSVIFNQQFELHKNELTARMIKVLDCGYENAEIVNEIKEKVDSIHENGRYNKKNIDRILTLQAICYDAGLVSLDEIVKVRNALESIPVNGKAHDELENECEEEAKVG